MNDFSFNTVKDFDNHINNSIRGYSDLISDVCSLSQYFVESGSKMVDIGCSTGQMLNTIEVLNSKIIPNVEYIGVENEPNMIDNQISNDNIEYCNVDVCEFEEWENISFVTSIFTLQFINRCVRQSIVNKIYDNMNIGGGFVFAEKIYSTNSKCQDMFTFMAYDYKRDSFTDSEILNKEKSLRYMLRPNTITELVGQGSMVQNAGFRVIEPFWRNLNFVGYIAVK